MNKAKVIITDAMAWMTTKSQIFMCSGPSLRLGHNGDIEDHDDDHLGDKTGYRAHQEPEAVERAETKDVGHASSDRRAYGETDWQGERHRGFTSRSGEIGSTTCNGKPHDRSKGHGQEGREKRAKEGAGTQGIEDHSEDAAADETHAENGQQDGGYVEGCVFHVVELSLEAAARGFGQMMGLHIAAKARPSQMKRMI